MSCCLFRYNVNAKVSVNLINSQQESFINHPGPIDWIELNEPATKLLYRDKRSKVTLVDIDSDQRTVLLSFCTYVQWVPMSDVIVAQSGDNLSVWYNPDLPEQVTNMKIKGEIEAVLRDADRTEVIVQVIWFRKISNNVIVLGTYCKSRI